MHIRWKLNSGGIYVCFKMNVIQKKFFTLETLKKMVFCFLGKTDHVETVPLEEGTTANSEWCKILCLPDVFGEQTRITGSYFTKTMLTTI